MGRKKLPAEILALRGTARRDRSRQPSSGVGEKVISALQCRNIMGYSLLGIKAKRFYLRRCREISALGILYEDELPLVLMMAMEFDTYCTACNDIKENGSYVTRYDDTGNPCGNVINPAYQIRNKAFNNFNIINSQFGLSPIDRQKIKFESDNESDPMQVFLTQYGKGAAAK